MRLFSECVIEVMSGAPSYILNEGFYSDTISDAKIALECAEKTTISTLMKYWKLCVEYDISAREGMELWDIMKTKS